MPTTRHMLTKNAILAFLIICVGGACLLSHSPKSLPPDWLLFSFTALYRDGVAHTVAGRERGSAQSCRALIGGAGPCGLPRIEHEGVSNLLIALPIFLSSPPSLSMFLNSHLFLSFLYSSFPHPPSLCLSGPLSFHLALSISLLLSRSISPSLLHSLDLLLPPSISLSLLLSLCLLYLYPPGGNLLSLA